MAKGNFAGYVNFSHTSITKIDELHITQTKNCAARFYCCRKLKVAEGTFPGFVDFEASAIEKIGDLVVTNPGETGKAACFKGCPNLKVAEGTFHGQVEFQKSGVTKIGKLHILTNPKHQHQLADFTGCDLWMSEKDLIPDYKMDASIRAKNTQRIAAAKAQNNQPEIEI